MYFTSTSRFQNTCITVITLNESCVKRALLWTLVNFLRTLYGHSIKSCNAILSWVPFLIKQYWTLILFWIDQLKDRMILKVKWTLWFQFLNVTKHKYRQALSRLSFIPLILHYNRKTIYCIEIRWLFIIKKNKLILQQIIYHKPFTLLTPLIKH